MEGTVPHCSQCKGVIKPDIVFFGEELPQHFFLYLTDFPMADLLIVMGTSLEVREATVGTLLTLFFLLSLLSHICWRSWLFFFLRQINFSENVVRLQSRFKKIKYRKIKIPHRPKICHLLKLDRPKCLSGYCCVKRFDCTNKRWF